MLDHLIAHFPIEIEVNVGQIGPAGMQKAFHRQVETQGIDVGNFQEEADKRVAGRAAQGHAVAAPPGMPGDVADDEEIPGQIGGLDDGQFLAQPLTSG